MGARSGGTGAARAFLLRAAAVTAAVCVVLISLMGGTAVASAQPSTSQRLHLPRSRFVEVPESPGSSARIRIDTDLYLPATVPAPAVLLAHGFGQDKRDLAPEARRLQGEGYVVLAYSARGFGRSGGRIGLDSLDGEVPDARALVDVLARDPDVLRQLPRDPAAVQRHRDPVIGVVGASYGGALALMLGATDPRIDSVVAGITWNDLAQALDPVSAGWVRGTSSQQRLFKAAWAARLFGTGVAGSADPCSRFTADVCALYRTLVEGGDMSDADLALVRRSSPSSVLDRMTAPTLLVQGLQDSLFGLDQADANARQIRKAGAPVSVDWFDGGHDGGGVAGTERATDDWLDRTLKHPATPSRAFEFDVPASATSFAEHHVTSRYPGLFGRVRPVFLGLTGATQTVVNPPGGQPASVTSLPGIAVNSDAGLAAGALFAARNPPDQAARFVTSPLVSPSVLVGHAFARIRVTPVSGVAQDAVLFAQLTALTGSVRRALPGGVAPIHVRVPAGGATVYVALPATTWRFATGDRIELTVRTTDSQFLGSTAPAAFRVAGRGALLLPQLTRRAAASAVGMPSRATLWRAGLLLGLLLLLLVGVAVVGRLRMRTARLVEASAGEGAAPLQVRGVTKRFRSGFVAVDDVSFTVERGQVVGLLGENGAGKTTTMRMLLGLTRPDAGTISSFGARVVPGAPVLRRIGALVEGPGFLPHLSGRRNLLLYWAATGRPRRDARLDEVLAVADLGTAIRRRVGGYSQGMRQRLAIAQAMLGMPDLLVLDEPTNGLDPPQIVALRGVLRRYAEGPSTDSGGSPAGSQRTVIVSSHLLGEVERTCSHLVVMSHGRIVAAGPVAEIAGGTDELLLEVGDPAAAIAALAQLDLAKVQVAGTDAVRILPGTVPTGQVLVALVEAGVPVTGMRSERHLEDAFLDLIGEAGPKS